MKKLYLLLVLLFLVCSSNLNYVLAQSFDPRGGGGFNSSDNSNNSTTKLPVIPCRANVAAPTWTEGFQVPCSEDLAGNTRGTLGTLLSGEVQGASQPLSYIQVREFPITSYSAALTVKTATAAGVTPFFAICGSATKTVKVQLFNADYTVATLGVHADPRLQKTSTATSAGTATALVKVPNDSTFAASTANLVNFYTVLATAGALVGTVDIQQVWAQATGTVTAGSDMTKTFNFRANSVLEAIVLRGIAECLEASFGTTTTNAPTMAVSVKWTEE